MGLFKKEGQEKSCPLLNGLIMASPSGVDNKGLIVPAGQPQPANIAFACIGERCKLWDDQEKECKIVVALDVFIDGAAKQVGGTS